MTPTTSCPRCGAPTIRAYAGDGSLTIVDAEPHPDGDIEIVHTIGYPVAFTHTQPDLLGAARHRLHRDSCGHAPAPHVAGSDTSKAAAEALTHKRTETDRQRIMSYLIEQGPATDEQIADALNMPGNTERPRRVELVERGDLTKHAEKGVTRSGRAANRWMVTPGVERRTA